MASHYTAANEAFIDENYDLALQEYTKAIEEQPTAEYYSKRAACYLKVGEPLKALQDAKASIKISPENNSNAYLRKGIAFFELEEYESAKEAFEQCKDHPDQNLIRRWIRKSEAEIGNENSDDEGKAAASVKINNAEPAKSNPQPTAADKSASVTTADLPPVKQSIRHEWYQTPTHVVITIFAKNVKQEQAQIEFHTQSLSVAIKTSESSEYLLDLALCDEIDPSKSTTSYLSTKVEIKLAKLRQAKWVSLEQVEAPFKTVAWDDASNVNKAEYPSSNKIKKNWDLIAKDIEEEKLEGDAALNKVFKDIYGRGSEEQRRAMMKSYVESSGTVLSTNWKDVGSRYVAGSAPKGAELKNWNELS